MRRVSVVAAAAAALLVVLSLSSVAEARSSQYYTIVEHVIARKLDYYAALDLTRDASVADIRKSYRTLSLKYHPDKTTAVGAHERFLEIANAYAVLSDEEARHDYDDILDNGIPWAERHYGRYAARAGVPVTDLRWVIVGLLSLITGLKHWYQVNKYHKFLRMGKEKARERLALQGVAVTEDTDPQVEIVNLKYPGWRDLFPVQLVMLPWTIYRTWFVDHVAEFKKANNMTDEQFELYVQARRLQHMADQMQAFKRYKRKVRAANKRS